MKFLKDGKCDRDPCLFVHWTQAQLDKHKENVAAKGGGKKGQPKGGPQ